MPALQTRPRSRRGFGVVLAVLGGAIGLVAMESSSARPADAPALPAGKLTFPTPVPVELKPAPLDRDAVELKLPGTVTDAVVGGGGRYWCLLLSDQKRIAVFDANRAAVVKSIPLAAGDVCIAAGMHKLLVVYPHLEVLVRYDLGTFEKELTAKVPVKGVVKQICLGAASAGPMLVFHGNPDGFPETAPVSLVDIHTLQAFKPGQDSGRMMWAGIGDTYHFRASPDGRLYGAWATSHTPSGVYGLIADEGGLKAHHEHTSGGSVVPSADGHLVTNLGLYTPEVKATDDRKKERFKNWTAGVRIPAQQGDWYLQAEPEKEPNADPASNTPRATKVTVHRTADPRPIMSLGDLGVTVADEQWARTDLTQDKRILFSPANGLVAWFAAGGDVLHLHKFDARAELDKAGADYLLVTSRPPAAEPGVPYAYPIAVLSKKGGVAFKLGAGPDGMKVAADGTLAWAPPRDWAGGDAVAITVSDKSGREVAHTFKLAKAAPPAKVAPPAIKPKPVADPPAAPAEPKAGLFRPPANPAKIAPTRAADGAVVKLPGTVDATCLGGNGRYLLLRISKLKQIAVLDVCEGKVVKYVPLPEEAALFAAGNEHLYVVAPKADTIQRWSLTTFEKEPAVPNPLGPAPRVALMGHATDGPLFVTGAGGIGLLDGRTLKPLDVRGGWGRIGSDLSAAQVRISGDGRVLGHWTPNQQPSGFRSVVLGDDGAKSHDRHESVGAILPGPDGTLFTSAGLHAPNLKPVPDKRGPWTALPPAHGRAYLAVSGPSQWNAKAEAKLTLRLIGENCPLAELGNPTGLDYAAPDAFAARTSLPIEERVFLVPDAHAMVLLNGAGDKVHIHAVDVEARLAKAGFDYLYVASRPGAARCGATFAYKPDVRSKAGGVTVSLDIGPDGMAVAADGTLVWKVPPNFADASVPVLLTVSDKSGQETFHAFTLAVFDRP